MLVAAARVGGILANDSWPAEFLYDNLMIAANVIQAARGSASQKLLFLGSSCIYPKLAPQPMREDACSKASSSRPTSGTPWPRSPGSSCAQAYRRQYGCDFISAMPTNLYGPGDNFDLLSSHVMPALIAKMHAAKDAGAAEVEVWGSGRPRREFLHVDDLADACVHLLKVYSDGAIPINVGSGADLTIAELAEKVRARGRLRGPAALRSERPDGTPQKLLDVSRLAALGWRPASRSSTASPTPTDGSSITPPHGRSDTTAAQFLPPVVGHDRCRMQFPAASAQHQVLPITREFAGVHGNSRASTAPLGHNAEGAVRVGQSLRYERARYGPSPVC